MGAIHHHSYDRLGGKLATRNRHRESVIGAPQYRELVIGEGQYREGYHRGGGQYGKRQYRGQLKERGILFRHLSTCGCGMCSVLYYAEARRSEEVMAVEEENRAKREAVIAGKAGVDRAAEKLMEERKAAAETRNAEKAEAALRLAEERAMEQQRKAEVVRQLRALEAVPKTAIRDVQGETSTTAGLGLLEDMSLAELKERLVIAKTRAKEEEDERRGVINKAKGERKVGPSPLVNALFAGGAPEHARRILLPSRGTSGQARDADAASVHRCTMSTQ